MSREGWTIGRDGPGRQALVLLANPTAGGGAAARIARQAVHTFAGLGLHAVLVEPGCPGEAAVAVREAIDKLSTADRPPRALVAVGGDGTIRVAAAVAMDAGLPMGIVPAGTGNGVAYSLGLPLDAWEACRLIATGTPQPCDLGRIEFPGEGDQPGDGRHPSVLFLNVAGVGLDAAITRVYHEDGLGVRGVPGYALATVRSLLAYEPVPLDLGLDGETLRLEALLVAIGNGSFYGKGIQIIPPARPSDGLLDVCVVLPAGLADLSSLVPMLLLARHTHHPKVRTFRARQVEVRTGAGASRSVPVHADGDVVGDLPVRISVIPGGIRLVLGGGGVPHRRAGKPRLWADVR